MMRGDKEGCVAIDDGAQLILLMDNTYAPYYFLLLGPCRFSILLP